ncbi:hypothetical protein PPL_03847 [Heterostelium album PN500]|uniref:C2H2-type domain-containing protein n=1 Tax=Heterostelium pallidum (strain ATCC 26659 / Pp 5 / PN500) TaxID=670386 RepID=D3B6T9_HETP5|nr:hypothetical protein PPL_03847 [Heterostelium album PN500]EFA83059.1 hypothetical protein PPL_03847 [Heterostelium album PN500]|eukprot:XP_020435176.1 hypothetical protein PPL_03847 [Heterostelium album PN500]
MGRYKGFGGTHTKNKQYKKARKTARRGKDIDQVWDDVQPDKIEKASKHDIDPELPGLGQFYCVHCAKYFVAQSDLDTHLTGKKHKRRVKDLKVKPYTVEDSQLPIDNGKKLRPTPTPMIEDNTDISTTSTAAAASTSV